MPEPAARAAHGRPDDAPVARQERQPTRSFSESGVDPQNEGRRGEERHCPAFSRAGALRRRSSALGCGLVPDGRLVRDDRPAPPGLPRDASRGAGDGARVDRGDRGDDGLGGEDRLRALVRPGGAKKPLVLLGYGLSSVARPLIGLAPVWPVVVLIRFVDRIGKGVRAAPRDTLIAAVTPPERRGAAFGLHRAFDNAGAVLGPLLAAALVGLAGLSIRTVFVLAAVPAALSLLVLGFVVKEKKEGRTDREVFFEQCRRRDGRCPLRRRRALSERSEFARQGGGHTARRGVTTRRAASSPHSGASRVSSGSSRSRPRPTPSSSCAPARSGSPPGGCRSSGPSRTGSGRSSRRGEAASRTATAGGISFSPPGGSTPPATPASPSSRPCPFSSASSASTRSTTRSPRGPNALSWPISSRRPFADAPSGGSTR